MSRRNHENQIPIALIGSVTVLVLAGYMVYDGMQVQEVKVSRVKLQPDKNVSKPAQKSAAPVATDNPLNSAAARQEKLEQPGKPEQSGKTFSASVSSLDREKSDSQGALHEVGASSAAKQREKSPINLVIPQENLSLLYIVKCSACHGKDGNGPVGPSIAGKSYEYNLKKLQEYKDKKVENTMMEDLLTRTPEEELKTLAKEISQFKTRSGNAP